ncbi:MAG: aspartate-semialdehyde dehydrogenase [Oscillospiraceae bacterium]|jgi:aspartate-semialdehyde dehydrogenase|nr:aspartate-semialdehyde dehydrogenase [Oscillospiraceae bacterium]
MKKPKVGILGATGMVGQRFVSLIQNHPWFDIKILAASYRSAGKTFEEAVNGRWNQDINISEHIKSIVVLDVAKDIKKITSNVDFVFCAVDMGKNDIKALEEVYAKSECPVISNNSAHRFTSDIPMVIPEVNPEHIKIIDSQRKRLRIKKGFIAVKSNCSVQCFVPAIHPIIDLGVSKILVCTYQAISGAGKTFNTWPEMKDNIIPYIPGEEEKTEKEPLKIWGNICRNEIVLNKDIDITSQCLRVPVSDGHTAAVYVKLEKEFSIENIIKKWDNFNSSSAIADLPSAPKRFIHYFSENDRPQIKSDRNLENGMGISVGRLREDSQYSIKFVCMSHNTIRGAAGGAVLLAELLCKEGYI